MKSVPLLAPCQGQIASLKEVPDQAFSLGLLGSGIALKVPAGSTNLCVTPCDGQLQALMAHAFVVEIDSSNSVLVHLGVDTYRQTTDDEAATDSDPEFSLLSEEKRPVQAGEELIRWSPREDSWLMMTLLPSDGSDARVKITADEGQMVEPIQTVAQLIFQSSC